MVEQFEMHLSPHPRGFYLVTEEITSKLPNLPDNGILNIFIKHTSAALAINENADYTVRMDFESFFSKIIPDSTNGFAHNSEGPDDMPAHLKASIIGQSLTIPISKGTLNLGTWQGIYLCEFRNRASKREIVITIIS